MVNVGSLRERKQRMRIFVLIPVFNRVDYSRRVLQSLQSQSLADRLRLIFINDGSTDDTATFLNDALLYNQPDLVVLNGDGNLWWAGAIQKGLNYLRTQRPTKDDYVLFLNNDVWFSSDYVETLTQISRRYDGAAVGSALHVVTKTPVLADLGPRVNADRFKTTEVLIELSDQERRIPKEIYAVDALSGRGTLYPALLFERFGGMRPCLLPHYFADYELAIRFHRNGVLLLTSSKAIVYSDPRFGNDFSNFGRVERYFRRGSSANLFHKFTFYLLISSPIQCVTFLGRLFFYAVIKIINKLK
jgi:GT2 family glycosyltransferase